PCVIIIGFVGGSGQGKAAVAPVTVSIDEQPMDTNGLTVVRWVYPLPPAAPPWRGAGDQP
ncbi:MAG: hypothetical protein JSS51_02495, partial [Planctomycetes bacterium]|nr:hypothetical protein [Planctomycetota bacterium]